MDGDAKVKIKLKIKNSKLQGILKNLIAPHNPPAQDGQGGPKPGYGPVASKLMGGPSAHKPPTPSDKIMSDRHIENRKRVDGTKDKLEAVKKSVKYNFEHKKEHDKALKKAKKLLKKYG